MRSALWTHSPHDITPHYTPLPIASMQCNAMQCNAMQCNAMQRNATQCNAMQRNATQCNATQCNAMQCNAMQCNAMQYNKVPSLQFSSLLFTLWHHALLHFPPQFSSWIQYPSLLYFNFYTDATHKHFLSALNFESTDIGNKSLTGTSFEQEDTHNSVENDCITALEGSITHHTRCILKCSFR